MTTMEGKAKKADKEATSTAPNKKTLYIRQVKVGSYEIVYEGGGETPDPLKGEWNKHSIASSALEKHLRLAKTKTSETRNGKGKDRV